MASQSRLERFVERFNELGSMRPGDYARASRNATYLIGLLNWADDRGEGIDSA